MLMTILYANTSSDSRQCACTPFNIDTLIPKTETDGYQGMVRRGWAEFLAIDMRAVPYR